MNDGAIYSQYKDLLEAGFTEQQAIVIIDIAHTPEEDYDSHRFRTSITEKAVARVEARKDLYVAEQAYNQAKHKAEFIGATDKQVQ